MIGVKREQAIERFLTQMPVRFETARGGPVGERRCWSRRDSARRRATSIEQMLVPAAAVAAVAREQRQQHERDEPDTM